MTAAQIGYLGNSGFRIDCEGTPCTLVFDDAQGCAAAVKPLAGRDVTVFVSHRHADHYSRRMFDWRAATVRYILSDDIRLLPGDEGPDIRAVGPAERITTGGLTVETFASTDEGVAFLVEAAGLTLFHAGDLNWWHWEGEPAEENRAMAQRYCREIDKLRGRTIDVAFLPVDPRLEEQALWGIDYVLRTVGVRAAVPMHFGGDATVFDRLMNDPRTLPYRDRIVRLARPGDTFRYTAEG